MPDEGNAGEPSIDPQKTKRGRFRDRLRQKLEKYDKSKVDEDQEEEFKHDNDVNDFLRKPTPSDALPPFPTPRRASVPRIDISVSKRFPGSLDIPGQDAPPLPSRGQSEGPKRRKGKRPGLHVKFTEQRPVVIGEGGDEAEAPPEEISRTRARSHSPMLERSRPSYDRLLPANGGQRSSPGGQDAKKDGSNEGFRPKVLVIAPTGLQIGRPSSNSAQDAEFEMTLAPGDTQDMASVNESGIARPRSAELRQKMSEEEGRSLHQGLRDPSPERPRLYSQSSSSDQPKSFPERRRYQFNLHQLSPGELPSQTSTIPFPSAVTTSPDPPQSISKRPHAYPSLPHDANNGPHARPPPYQGESASNLPFSAQSYHSHSYSSALERSNQQSNQTAGDDALADFVNLVNPYFSLFALSAENAKPSMETSLAEWVRASVWWFHRGETKTKKLLQSRLLISDGPAQRPPTSPYFHAIVSLAKSWWINQTIVPQHPEVRQYGNASTVEIAVQARNSGDTIVASLLQLHSQMSSMFRALTTSMKRNHLMPQVSDQMPLPQGLDMNLWIRYPLLAAEASTVLSGLGNQSLFLQCHAQSVDLEEVMPLRMSESCFVHFRASTEISVVAADGQATDFMPCVLTLTRKPATYQLNLAIASQNNTINLIINDTPDKGLSWEAVGLHPRSKVVSLALPKGFGLDAHLEDDDFARLNNFLEVANAIQASTSSELEDNVVLQMNAKVVQSIGSKPSTTFPATRIKSCRLLLSEKRATVEEDTGRRSAHRGYSLAVLTSPLSQTLAVLNIEFAGVEPVIFDFLQDQEDVSPAMVLEFGGSQIQALVITFHDTGERAAFHAAILDSSLHEDEVQSSTLALKSFSILSPAEAIAAPIAQEQWQSLKVISGHKPEMTQELSPSSLSRSMRVCMDFAAGTITDRFDLGPGQLQLSLPLNNQSVLRIWRPSQQDMTAVMAGNLSSPESRTGLKALLSLLAKGSTKRQYDFSTQHGLHIFEKALTGFDVAFDGTARSFVISRGRSPVLLGKKWDGRMTRIQLLRNQGREYPLYQIIAFFSDTSHGHAMNFTLKTTDVFETTNAKGKYTLKLVDAKFALPKSGDDDTKEFVCIDIPEWPSEHDDIFIAFDSVDERDRLVKALPNEAKDVTSRMASLRRSK